VIFLNDFRISSACKWVPIYTVLGCNMIKKIDPSVYNNNYSVNGKRWVGTGRATNHCCMIRKCNDGSERMARKVLSCRHNNFFPNVSLQGMRDVHAPQPPPTIPTNYTVWYSPEP